MKETTFLLSFAIIGSIATTFRVQSPEIGIHCPPMMSEKGYDKFTTERPVRDGLSVPYNETREVQESIVWFLSQLKRFILESQFKALDFDYSSERLGVELRDLEGLARDVLHNRQIAAQLKFATRMYETMVFSSQMIKQYNYYGKTDEYLLICVIELNVALMGLCNSYGDLDRSALGHIGKVITFWKVMREWEEQFSHLRDVSTDRSILFEDQKYKAEATVAGYWEQIVGGDHWHEVKERLFS